MALDHHNHAAQAAKGGVSSQETRVPVWDYCQWVTVAISHLIVWWHKSHLTHTPPPLWVYTRWLWVLQWAVAQCSLFSFLGSPLVHRKKQNTPHNLLPFQIAFFLIVSISSQKKQNIHHNPITTISDRFLRVSISLWKETKFHHNLISIISDRDIFPNFRNNHVTFFFISDF